MSAIQLEGEKYINEGKIHTKPNALTRQIKQILEKAAKARHNILQQDTGVKHICFCKAVMACLRSEAKATFIHLGHLMHFLSPLIWFQIRAHFSNCALWSTCWWKWSAEMLKWLVPYKGSSLFLPPLQHNAEVVEQAFFRSLTQRKLLLGRQNRLRMGTKSPQTGAAKTSGSFTGGEWKENKTKGKNARQRRKFVN